MPSSVKNQYTLVRKDGYVRMRHRAVRNNTHTHSGRQQMQRADNHRVVRKNTHAGLARNTQCGRTIVRSEKTHTLAGNEGKAPSCGQKKHTHWPVTNLQRGYAIARSEETRTLAGNEFRARMCHRAVRRNTHAGRQIMQSADAPSCGQKKHTRWPATNATVPMRHRAVRRNTHVGKQPMEKADAPSCGQKKHTRWPATTGKCGCAIVWSGETHTLAGNECTCGCAIVWSGETHTLAGNECTCGCAIVHGYVQNQKKSSSSPSHILCNSSGVFPKVK